MSQFIKYFEVLYSTSGSYWLKSRHIDIGEVELL